MKLQKIIGGIVLAGIVSLSATAVFADDSITFGKPIDLATKTEASELAAGQIIAIPVDINCTTNYIDSFTIKATGADGLTAGTSYDGIPTGSWKNLKSLGGKVIYNAANDDMILVASNVKKDNKGEVEYPGTYNAVVNGNQIAVSWMNDPHIQLTSDPELYLVYTVTSVPAALNVDLASVVDGDCSFSDTVAQGDTAPTPANETTTNKCEGAFKIVVDPAVMGEKRIHALHLYVNGKKTEKDITEYVEGETTFEFPVRLTDNENNLTGVVPIVIKADIGGATGEPTSTDVTVASFNLDLSKTATDYTTQAEAQTATAE